MRRDVHIHIHTADTGEFESKHPRASNGEFGKGGSGKKTPAAPTHRPDGTLVRPAPAEGSPALRRGVKTGSKVSYNYTDMHGTAFHGSGTVVGFAHNKRGGISKSIDDAVIRDEKRGVHVFVDTKNVRLLGTRK